MSSDYEKYLENKRKQKEEWFKKNPKVTLERNRKHNLPEKHARQAKKRPRENTAQKVQQRRKYQRKGFLGVQNVQMLKTKQAVWTTKRLEEEEKADCREGRQDSALQSHQPQFRLSGRRGRRTCSSNNIRAKEKKRTRATVPCACLLTRRHVRERERERFYISIYTSVYIRI